MENDWPEVRNARFQPAILSVGLEHRVARRLGRRA
jgi:hypothetical protein